MTIVAPSEADAAAGVTIDAKLLAAREAFLAAFDTLPEPTALAITELLEMAADIMEASAAAPMVKALTSASHALRSYQYGNSSPDLAEATADYCDQVLKTARGAK